ncbi:hypothetical protein [Asanoa iriomotensis]|nr:hypothetical protein [Asanoa iriomotensis]
MASEPAAEDLIVVEAPTPVVDHGTDPAPVAHPAARPPTATHPAQAAPRAPPAIDDTATR